MKLTLLLTLLSLAAVLAAPVSYTPPPETAHFKPGAGAEAVAAQCMMCHSAEYVSSQPTLSRATWKALVLKMQKVHGAPIPEAQVDTLVDYLAKTYGEEKPTSHKSAK